MSNEITKSKGAMLPAQMQDELLKISKSPKQYYAALTPIKAETPLTDATPTLSRIHRELGTPLAMMAVSEALMELKAWFNVKMNLNADQIAMIAEMILEVHWDLSLNDIKGCFREKMRNARLYGKLDGSDIMGWLDDYKSECIVAVQAMRDAEAREFTPSENAVSFDEWCKSRPQEGNYLAYGRTGKPPLTKEEEEKKKADFLRWKNEEYLPSKGITPK